MSDEHPLRKLIRDLKKRDDEDVERRESGIESFVELANNRAVDALLAVQMLAVYIIEKEIDDAIEKEQSK